jgi:hypothetical protein
MSHSYLDQCYLATNPTISLRHPETQKALIRTLLGPCGEQTNSLKQYVLVSKNNVVDIQTMYIAIDDNFKPHVPSLVDYLNARLESENTNIHIAAYGADLAHYKTIDKNNVSILRLGKYPVAVLGPGVGLESFKVSTLPGLENLTEWVTNAINKIPLHTTIVNSGLLELQQKALDLYRIIPIRDKRVILLSFLKATVFRKISDTSKIYDIVTTQLDHSELKSFIDYCNLLTSANYTTIRITLDASDYKLVNELQGKEQATRHNLKLALMKATSYRLPNYLVEITLGAECSCVETDFLVGLLEEAIVTAGCLHLIHNFIIFNGFDAYQTQLSRAIDVIIDRNYN